MRILRSALAVLSLAACSPAEPPTPPDPAAVRASLMAADQAFAAATAQNGLEGWMAAFDSSGIQMEPDVPFTPGIPAIRAAMAPAFADTTFRLTWQPTMAFASAAGDLGYTLGTWQSTHYNEAGKGRSLRASTSRSGGSRLTGAGRSSSTGAIPTRRHS